MNSKLQRLERQIKRVFGPRLMEIPLFRCIFENGVEETMSALEFAYATIAEGREGRVSERVGSQWVPINDVPEKVDFRKLFDDAQELFLGGENKC